jgi:hypothetical protein
MRINYKNFKKRTRLGLMIIILLISLSLATILVSADGEDGLGEKITEPIIDYIDYINWQGLDYEILNLIDFQIRFYPSFHIELLEGPSHNSDVVYVYVNSSLWDSDTEIQTKIYRYKSEMEATGFSVFLWEYILGSPDEIRTNLTNAPLDLVGCVLIGNIPSAWYQMFHDPEWSGNYSEFPIDLFYMDLDGTWQDNSNRTNESGIQYSGWGMPIPPGSDGIYDVHIDGTGDVEPEIWVGRIKGDDMNEDEVGLVKSYFDKNHNYRTGVTANPQNALVYVDDDWEPGIYTRDAVATAFPDYNHVYDKSLTIADYYLENLSAGYSWVHVMSHGNPHGHSFKKPGGGGGSLNYNTYRSEDHHVLFYNLFVCSGARFTSSNYLGGWCLFSGDTLGVIGSTKTGSMINEKKFYTPLSNGMILGEAYRDWFDDIFTDKPGDKPWYYGMTYLGDPTLRASGKHKVTIDTSGLDSATGVVHYVENGVSKDGDILGGTWSEFCDHGSILSIDLSVGISGTERYCSCDATIWTVAEPIIHTVTYIKQFLMTVNSSGNLLTSTYHGITNYLNCTNPSTGNYCDNQGWSDWCDIGSILTASEIVMGPTDERYHTRDTISWTVSGSATYNLLYHKEYKITIMADGLPDTQSTNITIDTANPSPSDDVSGGDSSPYVITLNASNGFSWTNWTHADTNLTALNTSIEVSQNEKYILICWTKGSTRYDPPTVKADTKTITYTAQYVGLKKEMSLDEADLCDSIMVTIEVSNPWTGTGTDTVELVDDLPNELSFVVGSAEIDGVPYSPIVGIVLTPEKHQQLTFTADGFGKHTITFEVKVNRAYVTDQIVENMAGAVFNFVDIPPVELDVLFPVTIHPYEGPSLSKSTDGPEIVPLFTEESWVFTYIVKNNYAYLMKNPLLKDHFGAELDYDVDTVIANLLSDPVFSYSKGKAKQLRLDWTLPDITIGEAFMLQVTVHTKTNPGGDQTFTEPGEHILNSGANLKWFNERNKKQSMTTETISVTAVGQIYGYVKDQDDAGVGVEGVIVEIYYNSVLIATAQTDSSGQYNCAEELTDSGVYTVKITGLPDGYEFGCGSSEETATYNVGQLDPTEVNFKIQQT